MLGGIGGFAGLFQLGTKYKNPVLVGCTDGVGTKVALSQTHNKLHLTGQDLVAMCVNDMITCGAEPLFFLDYFAASKLEPKSTAKIVKVLLKHVKKVIVRSLEEKQLKCQVTMQKIILIWLDFQLAL